MTIKLDGEIIDYFKSKSIRAGMPYLTLINMYLDDCRKLKKDLNAE